MSYETRISVVILATMFSGYCIGYVGAYTKFKRRLERAERRLDAINRWNGAYDRGDWF